MSGHGGAPAIRVQGLGHTYPGHSAPALRDVSFDVGRGEVVAVLGPSGATTSPRATSKETSLSAGAE